MTTTATTITRQTTIRASELLDAHDRQALAGAMWADDDEHLLSPWEAVRLAAESGRDPGAHDMGDSVHVLGRYDGGPQWVRVIGG